MLLRQLAAGRMGIVYEAVDGRSGERVALKTVDVPEPERVSSIRREIHRLSKLRHPGVIQLLAEGAHNGVPWYAMELLTGPTLASQLEARPATTTGALRDLLAVVHRICAALAFVHGEGVVHGDLKPANVILRPDGHPVLVDFGLSWQFSGRTSREVLDDLTGVTGTPAYMAPEQILDEPLDARADLYALGCIVFEILTGAPPLLGADPRATLLRRLTERPPAPSTLNPAVPPDLDALALALLQPSRAARLGYAVDAMAALERFEPGIARGVEVAANYVYKPGLAGRRQVIADLEAAADAAASGRGQLVLISGESGVGKTYVAAELARRASERLRVVVGACGHGGAGAQDLGGPFHPMRNVLRAVVDRCVVQGEAETPRLLGTHGPLLAAYEASLSDVPGYRPVPPSSGPGQREQIFAALRHVLAAMAAATPMVVVLDDLQWADELTLGFLRSLPEGWLGEQPLFLVLTARSEEISPEIAEIRSRSDVREVRLGGLDAATIDSLVREMLALDRVPTGFAAFLARQSVGNPFYVSEYLRTGLATGILRRLSAQQLDIAGVTGDPAARDLAELPLPVSLRDLIARRIAGLTPLAQIIVETGALFGREFDADLVQGVAELEETNAMEAVAELLRLHFIEPGPAGRLRFVHDKLHEIAYARLEPARRRELHATIARALEDRAPSTPQHYGELAHHWGGAEDAQRELVCRDKAGETALAAAAFADAARHFRRAIDLMEGRIEGIDAGEGRPAVARWDLGIASAEQALGDVAAVEEHARRALVHLGWDVPVAAAGWVRLIAAGIPVQVAHMLGIRGWRSRTEESRARRLDAARAASLLTGRFFYSDDAAAMLGISLLGANLAESAGAASEVPRAYLALGLFSGFAGLKPLARRYFDRSRAAAAATNDPVERAFHLVGLGAYDATFGRWRAADEAAQRALSLIGDSDAVDPFTREIVATQAGHVDYYLGRYEAALIRYREILASARRRNNPQTATWALFSIGRSLLALGRDEEASAHLTEAWDDLEKRPELQSEIICLGLAALASLRLGREGDALARADAALARIARARSLGFPAAEGYGGTLAVYLSALARGENRGGDVAERARRCASAFRRFARLARTAEPLARLQSGHLWQAEGRPRRARRAYHRALAAASRMELPRERALALWALSSLPSTDTDDRRSYAREAEALASQLARPWPPEQPF